MELIIVISIWYAIGLFTYLIDVIKEGYITINDLIIILFFSLFGPINLIVFLYYLYNESEIGEKCIWKSKK